MPQNQLDIFQAKETSNTKQDEVFESVLSGLNEKQKEAVDNTEGPVLVVAGPGTGKTQIIAARIGKIIQSTDTSPSSILCLTYTDAGTIAMRKRLTEFIGPLAYQVHIYTFHAFCNDVIQSNLSLFGKWELEPISDLENIQILYQLIDNLDTEHPLKRLKGDIYFETSRLDTLFQMMKREGWTVDRINQSAEQFIKELPLNEEYIYKRGNSKAGYEKGDLKQHKIDEQVAKMEELQVAAELFPVYESMLLKANRYDYADMILWVIKAFKENEDLIKTYQEQYLYFLVDEYQDTSGSQNELLHLLIDYWESPNVFVVGDDDQSIYEFQGARVKNIVDFYKRYEAHIKLITLTNNYRSTQEILDTSKLVIDHNEDRLVSKIEAVEKTLLSSNPKLQASSVKPQIIEYPNTAHEEADIVLQIDALHKKGVNLNEVAVIYYRHKQAADIIQLLEKRNVPYKVKKRINILELITIKQFVQILKYIQAEHELPQKGAPYLFEIMHFNFIGFKPLDVAKIAAHCGNWRNKTTWRSAIQSSDVLKKIGVEEIDKVVQFSNLLTEWTHAILNETLQSLIERIVNESGLLSNILNGKDKHFELDVIKTFFSFVQEESAKNPNIKLSDMLQTIEQMESNYISLNVNKSVYQEEGVEFVTAHSSKGLEFQHVFLIGCTKDMWEKSRSGYRGYSLPDTLTNSVEENKIETSRRLFYVAMTRAKEHLSISYSVENVNGKGLERSQFVEECLENLNLDVTQKHVVENQLFELQAQMLTKTNKSLVLQPEKDFLDNLLKNYALSVTHLNQYLKCPVAFYYENILRVPGAKNQAMGFGSAVHHALQRLFEKMKADPQQVFPSIDDFLKDFYFGLQKNAECFTPNEYKLSKALGDKVLPEYYDEYVNQWNKICVVEYRVGNTEVNGIPIHGFLDKIEFNGNDVNVIDYKTANPDGDSARKGILVPSDKNPNGGDYWRQIIFYKILLDNLPTKNWNMVSGEIDYIEKSKKENAFKKQKVMVREQDILFVKNQIQEVYAKIKNHEFQNGCGEEHCKWCEFSKAKSNSI